ncbi:type II toxin-antitoxin system RelE/ParE family toxin [Endozoicomonas sp. 2B-B]
MYPIGYSLEIMKFDLVATEVFQKWRKGLKDRQAAKAIAIRLERARAGHLGDVQSVGNQVSEMRIFVGKGYRLYFTIRNRQLIALLCGGDKSSQKRDILKAHTLIEQMRNDDGTET